MDFPSSDAGSLEEEVKWALFGQRYKVDTAAFRAPPFRQAAPTILVRPGATFTGQVDTLRIARYGRFGNNFYQILNSLILAQRMGCTRLEIPQIDHVPESFSIEVDNIRITSHAEEIASDATLCASFYWPTGMEAALDPYSAAFANQTVEKFIRPIYAKYCNHLVALGDDVLLVNFRGGDVFARGSFAMWYVQPPASFYLKSIEYAQRRLGITKVHLVYEDTTNPSVDIVLKYLTSRGIAYSCEDYCQSSKIFDHATALMSARHIVASYSTFCEASALLANRTKSYFAFRRVASQRRIPFWAQSRLADMLAARGVKTIVIDDPDRSYIKEECWFNTPDQLALMRDYPMEKLHVA